MNTGHFAFGFKPIRASELLFGKTALVLCKFGRVVCGIAGIAGFKTVAGDEQILNTHVDTHLFIGDRQQRGIEFTQARHKIATCVIFRNGDRSGVRRKRLTPFNIQGLITLSQLQFTASEGESAVSKLRRLAMFFRFKGGVFSPPFKEVLKCRLLVAQALLQRDTGNVVEKQGLRLFFESGQSGVRAGITDLLLTLSLGIGAVTQDTIVNIAHTAKGLRQQLLLLGIGVKPELVGAFR